MLGDTPYDIESAMGIIMELCLNLMRVPNNDIQQSNYLAAVCLQTQNN